MDAVGAASSIITLVDLAKKLYEFWKAIEDAPGDIREITENVITLKSIVERIACEYNEAQNYQQAVTEILHRSERQLNHLLAYFDGINIASFSARRRKWAAIKAAFRKDKINQFQVSLESTKTSLILAQSLVSSHLNKDTASLFIKDIDALKIQQTSTISTLVVMHTQLSNLEQHMKDIHSEIVRLCMAQSTIGQNAFIQPLVESITRQAIAKMVSESKTAEASELLERTSLRTQKSSSHYVRYGSYNSVIGRIHYHTVISTQHVGRKCIKTSIKIVPAPWLAGLCLTVSTEWSSQQLTWTIQPTPLRPWNSPIFLFSKNGNLDAIKALLNSGQASPRDTDPYGWTALHHAARWGHHETCSYLLRVGANVNAVAYMSDIDPSHKPFTALAFPLSPCWRVEAANQLQTMRILLEEGQPEAVSDEFVFSSTEFNTFRLLVGYSGKLLGDGYDERGWPFLLKCIRVQRSIESIDLLINEGYSLQDRIVIRNPEDWFDGWSILHFEFYNGWDGDENDPLLDYLLSKELDIHCIGSDGETPTSLAMDHPKKFRRWIQALLKMQGFNAEEFCATESANPNCLRDDGWTKESLLKLFKTPIPRLKALYHEDGPQSEVGGYITWWETQLQNSNPQVEPLYRSPCGIAGFRRSPPVMFSRDPRRFIYTMKSDYDILWVDYQGEGFKQKNMTAFDFNLHNGKGFKRYDTLIRIWPSATNNRTPYTKTRRFRNWMFVYVRRWEWCIAVIMKQSWVYNSPPNKI